MRSKIKHNRIIHIAVIFTLVLFATGCEKDDPIDEYFDEGSGTIEDPYLIETAEDLDNVRNAPDKHYKQVADIDLST